MKLEDFNLVEAFDKLSACEGPETTWASIVEIGKDLGLSAINIGQLDLESAEIIWARSSMPQSWLDLYMSRAYYTVDPLIQLFNSRETRKTVFCDPRSIEAGKDGGDPALSQALCDAGFRLLHGTKFVNLDANIGTMVTLCFNEMDADEFAAQAQHWTMVSALFSGFNVAPAGSAALDVFAYSLPELTEREKAVLRLLAQGHKTARIAWHLDLAEITVTKYFQSSRRKLNATTREQAVITAMRHKLISF